jgi:putative NADH-flavin reductase
LAQQVLLARLYCGKALQRGRQVTAIVRHPEKLPVRPVLIAKKGAVTLESEAAALLAGHAAVISACSPGSAAGDVCQQYISSYHSILKAMKYCKCLASLVSNCSMGGFKLLQASRHVRYESELVR